MVADGVMLPEGRGINERIKVQVGLKKRSLFNRMKFQAWLVHTALPVFIPNTVVWLLTSLKETSEPSHSFTSLLFFFLTFWLTIYFPFFIFLSPLCSVLVPSLSLSPPPNWAILSCVPVARMGMGSVSDLQVSIATFCFPM